MDLFSIGQLFTAVGVIIIAYSVMFAVFLANKWIKQERRARTFDLILMSDAHSTHTVGDKNYFSEIASRISEGDKSLQSDERYKFLIAKLNKFEAISIGIREGFYDENILREYFGQSLIYSYRNAQKFIEQRRNVTGDSRLYVHLEAIARRWEDKRGF